MDMTVIRDLAKVYNTNGQNREAVELYEKARNHYMSLPQQIKADGDLNTPFDWCHSTRLPADLIGTN